MKFKGFDLCESGEIVDDAPLISKEERDKIHNIFHKLGKDQVEKLISGAEAALKTALMFKDESDGSIKGAIDKINDLKKALDSFDDALARIALNPTAAAIMRGSLIPYQDESEGFLVAIIHKFDIACSAHALIAKGRADKGIEKHLIKELVDLYAKVTGKLPGKTKSGPFQKFVEIVAGAAGLAIGEKLINAQIEKTTLLAP